MIEENNDDDQLNETPADTSNDLTIIKEDCINHVRKCMMKYL